MKRQQAKHIVGHVTLHIKGRKPELFFQFCVTKGVLVWDIEKTASDGCKGTIYLQSLSEVQGIIEETHYELVSVKAPKGLFPSLKRLWHRKEIILTALLCMLLLFALSNIAWKIDIDGVPEEMERKIQKTLKNEGLYKGAWTFNLTNVDKIQQHALHALPDLMYIGIRENGTTYHIDAIEKQQEEKAEEPPKRDLIAAKDGEIKRIFVKNGISQVAVHDIVKKGDLLVSGLIENEVETEEDDKEKSPAERVPAEGTIYANTWYEMSVSSALEPSKQHLTGESHKRFHLVFPSFSFPIWGFKQPYTDYITEEKKHSLQMFEHKFPVTAMIETLYEVRGEGNTESKEEAKERAIRHIENKLQRKSGNDAEVLYYKVLHERTENGKVKINLYVSVLENIAEEKVLN